MTHPYPAEFSAATHQIPAADHRPVSAPPGELRPGELITGAELDSLIEQSTAPMASYVEQYRAELRTWAGRQAGGVAEPDQRAAGRVALAMLDALAQELMVLRTKLIAEIRANDDRDLAHRARARELALEQAEVDRGERCGRCGRLAGVRSAPCEACPDAAAAGGQA